MKKHGTWSKWREKVGGMGVASLFLCLGTLLCSASAFGDSASNGDWGYEYSLEDGTAVANSYSGTSASVTVHSPVTLQIWTGDWDEYGNPITEPHTFTVVGVEGTFYENTTIKSVTLPSTVTNIGSCTFYKCSSLSSIILGTPPTHVGDNAFYACGCLTSGLDLSACREIERYAFQGCSSYPFGDLVLPRAKKIEGFAFWWCGGMTSVRTSPNLEELGECAFQNCIGLTNAVIEGSELCLNGGIFSECPNLESVTIGNGVVPGEGGPFGYDNQKVKTVTVGTGFTNIPPGFCGGLESLETATFRGNIRDIGSMAFYECGALTTLSIGGKPTHVGNNAFYGCGHLTESIDLSECEEIEGRAFQGCGSYPFGDLVLPRAKKIEGLAFWWCGGMTSVRTSPDLEELGECAFQNCIGLTNAVIEGSELCLNGGIFSECPNLESVTIGNGVVPGEGGPFGYDNQKVKTVTVGTGFTNIPPGFCGGLEGLETATFRGNIQNVGDGAFSGCEKMKTVSMGGKPGRVGSDAFSGCHRLTGSIDLSECLNLGRRAFYGCGELAFGNLALSAASNIEEEAFEGCAGLTSVTTSEELTNLGRAAFRGCNGLVSASIDGTGLVLNDEVLGNCANLETITLGDGVVGVAFDEYWGYARPFPEDEKLRELTVGTGFTMIPNNFCSGLANLETATFHGNIQNVGDGAFSGCEKMKTVSMGGKPGRVGSDAFSECYRLTGSIDLSECLNLGRRAFYGCGELAFGNLALSAASNIEEEAFEGCAGLTSVTTTSELTNLGGAAFRGCNGLVSASIDGTGLVLNDEVLGNCANLETVTLGDGVAGVAFDEYWGYARPFPEDEKLRELTVGTGFTMIPNSFCSGLGNLETATFRGNIQNVGDGAFSGCEKMRTVSMGGKPGRVGNDAFSGCHRLTGSIELSECREIEWHAFYGCGTWDFGDLSLDSTTSIGEGAFEGCEGLTDLHFSDTLTYIGPTAFARCANLTNVWFAGAPPEADDNSFQDVAEGARGHYTEEHAAEWEAVIDENGMWKGLVFDDPETYTVSFDANGGEGGMEPMTVVGEDTVSLPANAFWRTDYRFAGWAATENGEVVYEDCAEISVERDMTLWAVWDYVEPPSIYGVKVGPYSDWDFSEIVLPKSAKTRAAEPELYHSLENCLVLTEPTPTVKPLIKIRLQDRPNGTYRCLFKNKFYDVNEQPTKVIQENGIQYGLYEVSLIPFEKIEVADLTDPNSYGPKKEEITLIWTIPNGNKTESGSKSETFEYNVFFDPLTAVECKQNQVDEGGQPEVVERVQLWYLLWKQVFKDEMEGFTYCHYDPEKPKLGSTEVAKPANMASDYLGKKEAWTFWCKHFIYEVTKAEPDKNILVNKSFPEREDLWLKWDTNETFFDDVYATLLHERKHSEIWGQYTQIERHLEGWRAVGDSDNDGLNDKQEDDNQTSRENPNTKNILYSRNPDQEIYVREAIAKLGTKPAFRYYNQDWSSVGAKAPEKMRRAKKSAKDTKKPVCSPKGDTTSLSMYSTVIPQQLYDVETDELFLPDGEAPDVSFSDKATIGTDNISSAGLQFMMPVAIGTATNLHFYGYLLDRNGNALAKASTSGAFAAGQTTVTIQFSASTMAAVAKNSFGPYVLDRIGCHFADGCNETPVWSESPLISEISCSNVVWHSEESYVAGDGQCMKTFSGLAITLPVFLPAAGTYKFAARLVPDAGSQAISVAREEVQVAGLGIVDVTLNFPADDISRSKHTGAFRLHSLSVRSEDADVGDWLVPNFKTPSYSYTEFQSSEQSVFINAETLSDSILYDDEGMAVSLAVSFTASNSDAGQLERGRFKAVLESEDGREVARFNETFPMTNASDTYVLAFSGADIRAAGVAGPYVLASLSIEDPDTGEILDAVTSASWKTAAYGTSTFATGLSADAATFVLGEVKDAGAEQSGIRLSGTVEIPIAGIVGFEANLVNAAGTQVCSGYSQTDCPDGVSTVSLVFPAPAIFQSGLDGPYYVTSAMATYSGTPEEPVSIPLALETQPYACGDFAKWSNYMVTFDRQNGSGGTASVTATHGEAMPDIMVPTRNGYAFLGYYTEPNGEGIQYYTANGMSARNWDRVEDTTLYAYWTDRQTVTFNPNGGTCKTSSRTAVVGETYTKLASATREGYKFVGWYDAQEGGNRVKIGDTVPPQAERTLYARWEGLTQTVHFDANGGTCKTASRKAVVGATYTKLASATRDGYKFVGWYDAREGGNRVRLGDSVPPQTERTLFARWEGLSQTVRFDANGGTCKTSSRTAVVGETYTKLASATREAYKFVGWYDAPEGGNRVRVGDPVPPQTERTLWARWKGRPQTVRFDANGGTCSKTTATYIVGETYSGFKTATRNGFTFKGWYTAKEGGTRVKNGMTVTVDSERTLFAHWQAASGTAGAPSITAFVKSVAPAGARSMSEQTFTVRFDAVAGNAYEIQWTPVLGGEWETVARWTAGHDGEAAVPVAVPVGAPAGFFRVVAAE